MVNFNNTINMKKLFAILGSVAVIMAMALLVRADNQQESNSGAIRNSVPNSEWVTVTGAGITNVGTWHKAFYTSIFGAQIPFDIINFGISTNGTVPGLFYGIAYDPAYAVTYGYPSLGSTNAPFKAVLTTVSVTSTNLAAPTPPSYPGGTLWSSNSVLYWVTTNSTTKIAGP
jgi:hypothetical protein